MHQTRRHEQERARVNDAGKAPNGKSWRGRSVGVTCWIDYVMHAAQVRVLCSTHSTLSHMDSRTFYLLPSIVSLKLLPFTHLGSNFLLSLHCQAEIRVYPVARFGQSVVQRLYKNVRYCARTQSFSRTRKKTYIFWFAVPSKKHHSLSSMLEQHLSCAVTSAIPFLDHRRP